MNKMLQPTGAILVGLAFLLSIFYLQSGIAESSKLNYPESLNTVREYHDRFTSPIHPSIGLVQPNLSEMAKALHFADENIFMKGSSQSLEGLITVNGAKRRSIAFDNLVESSNCRVNAMNIAVSGITVIAINMGKGGSAVATSDIVLRPVQSLGGSAVTSSEVEEKLK
jgi:hypothetical protein